MPDFAFNVTDNNRSPNKRQSKRRKAPKDVKTLIGVIGYCNGITVVIVDGNNPINDNVNGVFTLTDKSRSIKGCKTFWTGIDWLQHRIELIEPSRESIAKGRHKYRIDTVVKGYVNSRSEFEVLKVIKDE